MRINLPNYHCTLFELTSEFSVSKDKNAEIDAFMNVTLTDDSEHAEEDDARIAYFGARTRNGGITHRVQGRLDKTLGSEELAIRLSILSTLASNELRPPPREFKPVSFLVDSATELFGPVAVSCNAVFNYDLQSGFVSAISLPMPLIVQGGGDGFTHLESIQLSRRIDDEVNYRVIVAINYETNLLLHSVDFDSTIEWSQRSVRDLFRKARSISRQLLIPIGES